jgi:hypothetical protein
VPSIVRIRRAIVSLSRLVGAPEPDFQPGAEDERQLVAVHADEANLRQHAASGHREDGGRAAPGRRWQPVADRHDRVGRHPDAGKRAPTGIPDGTEDAAARGDGPGVAPAAEEQHGAFADYDPERVRKASKPPSARRNAGDASVDLAVDLQQAPAARRPQRGALGLHLTVRPRLDRPDGEERGLAAKAPPLWRDGDDPDGERG